MTAPKMPGRMPGPVKLPDPSYAGDDYDRTGCTAAVEVNRHGYGLRILSPSGSVFESYRTVKTPHEAARMLQDWLEGKVPRPASTVTQVVGSGS